VRLATSTSPCRAQDSARALDALVVSLTRLASLDLDRALTTIAGILRRAQRRDQPREPTLKRASEALASFAVWRDVPQGHAALRELLRDPPRSRRA
jgi:hypothetical protein